MPQGLTEEQKDFITATITHLIDLSEEPLADCVAKLKQALRAPTAGGSENEGLDDYALLQKCYHNPTTCFNRLENLNPEITIREVQKYILRFITAEIEKAAALATTTASALLWDHDYFLLELGNEAEPSPAFISQAVAFDTGNEHWQLPIESGKIFTAKFAKLSLLTQLDLLISIDLPDKPILLGTAIPFPDDIQTDIEEDQFIQAQIAAACEDADFHVACFLLDHLINLGIITRLQSLNASYGAGNLISYRYYFKALVDQTLLFDEISSLEPHEAEALGKPAIRSLIAAGKCTIDRAKNLSPQTLQVIEDPFYYQEIINNHIQVNELIYSHTQDNKPQPLSKRQSALLTLPGIIYLQRKGKISLNDAKSIMAEAATLFKNESGIHLIMQNILPFQALAQLKRHHAELIIEPYYYNQIIQGQLLLPEIQSYSPQRTENLRLARAISLQEKNKLLRAEASDLAPCELFIIYDPFYFHLLSEGSLAFSRIKNISAEQASLLLKPEIKALLESKALDIEDLLIAQGKLTTILLYKNIRKLLLLRKVRFAELQAMPLRLAQVLERNLCLYGLIFQNIFKLSECLTLLDPHEMITHPLIQWGLSFGGRIIGIFKDQPYYENGEPDSLELILNDIEFTAKANPCYFKNELLEQAIKIFIRYLKNDLEVELQKQVSLSGAYQQLLIRLLATEKATRTNPKRSVSWMTALHLLKETALQNADHLVDNPEAAFGKRGEMSFSLFQASTPLEGVLRIQLLRQKLSLLSSSLNRGEVTIRHRI